MNTILAKRRDLASLFVLVLTLGGCASPGGGTGIDRDVITEEQLEARPENDILQVIQNFRPQWLQLRSSRTFVSETRIRVIIDDVPRLEGIDLLRGMSPGRIRELRYLSANDATTRFGPDMAGGAILVYRKTR